MTLHWWMHWFWVTGQLAGILIASPLPSTTQDPIIQRTNVRGDRNLTIDTRIDGLTSGAIDKSGGSMDEGVIGEMTGSSVKNNDNQMTERGGEGITNFRVAKAINSYDTKSSSLTNNNSPDFTSSVEITTPRGVMFIEQQLENEERSLNRESSRNKMLKVRASNATKRLRNEQSVRIDETVDNFSNDDSKITWLSTTRKTPTAVRSKKNDNLTSRTDVLRNFSKNEDNDENKDLTVLPLRIESARFKLIVNSTRTITADSADGFSTRTFNGSEDIEIDQELAQPRLSATAASILQDFLTAGISESTRLSRARNAFTSDFQRDREDDRSSVIDANQIILEANESIDRDIETSSSPSVVDIAAITGSCLATIVLLSTMASLGFIMYRRKYLNPPQTLNSDKCSNPDSSGYIDDSTIRDNSEEMYSLDNDSFLNSLEAMTIQNYWTDSVKHTKL